MNISKKISNFCNSEIKCKTFPLPKVPEQLSSLHFLALFTGASGSGKTTTAINYINKYKQHRVFDHITLISPTGIKSEILGVRPEAKWEGIADSEYANYSSNVLNKILDDQHTRIKKYFEYKEHLDLYKRFINGEELDYMDMLLLYDKYDYQQPQNPNPTGNDNPPTLLIICDDIAGDEGLKRGSTLEAFVTKSRHYNCSVMILIQYYYMVSSGMRRQMNLHFVFKTGDKKYLENLYKEVASGDMTYDEWLNMFKMLEHRHEFILIDTKRTYDKYRKNFDQILNV